MNDVADGLSGEAKSLIYLFDRLLCSAGKQDLTAFEGKSVLTAQPGFELLTLFTGKFTHKDRGFHAQSIPEKGRLSQYHCWNCTKNAQGRTIRGYKFGDPSQMRGDEFEGRKQFSKAFKEALLEQTGSRCAVCLTEYDKKYLQIDHRVPYRVSGETLNAQRKTDDYMLLCRSCNRAKSWYCEHCPNWLELKSVEVCRSCYWTSPDVYKHIALQATRRLEVVWTEQEVENFEQLRSKAEAANEAMPEYVKTVLKQHLDK